MIPYLLAAVGGYLLGTAKDETTKYAKGGSINDSLWESVKNKFSEVFFEEESENEIYSNEVKAEEYKWQFDRYSKYASPLSWEDAKRKFLGMLTDEEKKIISIEYDVRDVHELFGVMSSKKIVVKKLEFAKGGMVVTSIKDIPNFKERLDEGKITYRGLGLGKLYDRFYDLAGENGVRIKVDGKEYYITDSEFNTFSRDSQGRMRIRFDAPYRKYAEGGVAGTKEYQIKKTDGTYFYLKMSTGNAGWAESADMGYQYTQEEAEKVKDRLEKEGYSGLSIVKYDKDWWKNAPDEFAKGGKVKKKYAILRSRMGEIIADIEVETEDRLDALKQFIDLGIDVTKGTIYFTDTPPHYYAKGGEIKWQDIEVGDSARVKDINKTGVVVKTYGRKFHLKFVDGTEKTYDANELEFFKK